jgi:predicted tellurium resistance membrane protein TerC
MLSTITNPAAWAALLALVFLELALGIDNIVFLSIISGKAPLQRQPMLRRAGLLMAMAVRIALLFGVSLLIRLTQPLLEVHTSLFSFTLNGQSIILCLGGMFLLYKSASEIHSRMERSHAAPSARSGAYGAGMILLQIVLLDIVFSLDSILTAIGMVSFSQFGYAGGMCIMIAAIVLTVLIMLFFAAPVSAFVNRHPTVQMLALSFLILIGAALLVEAGAMARLHVLGSSVGGIPKGYIYFAIAFALLVEALNLRMKSKQEQPIINNE